MNKLIITSINYVYEEGHDKNYSKADIHFINRELPFQFNGKVTATRAEYQQHQGDMNELKLLLLKKAMQQFGKQLAE